MAECLKCGTTTVPGETFCSNCGTRNPVAPKEASAASDDRAEDSGESNGAARAIPPEPTEIPGSEASDDVGTEAAGEEADLVSSHSLGGSTTDEVPDQSKHTIKKGNTGGHQPTVKQLDPGSVL